MTPERVICFIFVLYGCSQKRTKDEERRVTEYTAIHLDSVDSTNTYAKGLDINAGPYVVISETQTAGRGRLGRSFCSPAGSGIYMSIALSSDAILVPASLITIAAAVSVCDAIEDVCGVSPRIKWVNDLFLNNKKICGILTESTDSKIIVGIGVNCFPGSFPEELSGIVGAISESIEGDARAFDKDALAEKIAANVLSLLTEGSFGQDAGYDYLAAYRERCFILGRQINVTNFANQNGSPSSFLARAVDISPNGGLIVEPLDGPPLITLISGEVSVHLD